VQIAETSCPENPFEAITGVSVNGANESDQHQALPVINEPRSRLESVDLVPFRSATSTTSTSTSNGLMSWVKMFPRAWE